MPRPPHHGRRLEVRSSGARGEATGPLAISHRVALQAAICDGLLICYDA